SFGARIGGIGRDANTRRDLDVDVWFLEPHGLADQLVKTSRYTLRVLFRSLRKQQHEFVAAIAERKVDKPALVLDGLPDFRQRLRSHQVPVSVVHVLEVIEVNENEREFKGVAM